MPENRTDKSPLAETKQLAKKDRITFEYQYKFAMESGKKKKIGYLQPHLIKNYNQHMGGVDKHDWLVGKYNVQTRGKKANSLSSLEIKRCVAMHHLKLGHLEMKRKVQKKCGA
ncbi:hypothetical protein ILUMI_03240 [Ignelater luminosus]|uniref:Uncharacterized protein n=1 Tax=Ignelater luminosus TaxID=2038154 RepID=A0A8K0GFP5_IGNLU|nr:hypothetical protein ILUMI_03240 [Ignelater luminosus]